MVSRQVRALGQDRAAHLRVDLPQLDVVHQEPIPEVQDCRGTRSFLTYYELNSGWLLQALFLGTFKYDGRRSVMESTLNTHPLALKYLMPALMHIYVGE